MISISIPNINKVQKPFVKLLLLTSLFIYFAFCTGSESIIEGKLPDASYDSEVVYLVPVNGATKATVDSALIQNSRFRFKVKPKKQNQIFILRVKPLLRIKLQELLVITEPGTVYANLGAPSSAFGTPLNQTLQRWKERKYICDSIFYTANRQLKQELNETEKAQFQSEIDAITKEYQAYIDSVVEKNKDNAVGKFIQSLRGL